MKNMALGVGDVNLRFTCCTFITMTYSTPSYCDEYEKVGEGGLVKYCQNDYQNYGGPEMYVRNGRRRRLSDQSDVLNAISTSEDQQHVNNPTVIETNILSKEFKYVGEGVVDEENKRAGLYSSHQVHGDYQNLEQAREDGTNSLHQIRIWFESGETKYLYYKEKFLDLKVPPVNLFDETLQDDVPSSVSMLQSKLNIVVDGSSDIREMDFQRIQLD